MDLGHISRSASHQDVFILQQILSFRKAKGTLLSGYRAGSTARSEYKPADEDRCALLDADDDFHGSIGGSWRLHPIPVTVPVAVGEALAGCARPAEQLEALFDAAEKYRAYRHWDRIRLGCSELVEREYR